MFRDGTASTENPEVIENLDSERTAPSVVTFEDSQVLVGKNALNARVINPTSTFYCVKRLIGRKFNDSHVNADKKSYTYRVFNSPNGKPVLRVATKRYNQGKKESGKLIPIELEPEQISALVLGYLKNSADKKCKVPTNKVVITVPANFNEYQKRATKDAALIAGLDPIDTISEPTAACITYACLNGYSDKEKHVLVYDYGGGTLDVSLVKIKGDDFVVVATAGDSHCGGADIDQHLFKKQVDEVKRKFEVNIAAPEREDREDKYARQRALLLNECEQKKIHLSGTESRLEINLNEFFDGKDFKSTITRNDIEEYVSSNKEKLIGPINRVFEQSGLPKDKVTDFILVGGSCRIPAVQNLIAEEYGKKPFMPLNPDEAIAKGAAIYGACKLNKQVSGFKKFNIVDVTPMDIGIGVRNSKVDIQIKRNTPIPCTSEWIRYKKPIPPDCERDTVSLPVFEGDSPDVRNCHKVGKFDVVIDPKDYPEGFAIVYARISVSDSGITVHAADATEPPKTENYKKRKIETDQIVHSTDDINRMKNQNKEYTTAVITEDEIVYHQRCIAVFTVIVNSRNKIAKETSKKNAIKKKIDEIKKRINAKYIPAEGPEKLMTKEEYLGFVKEAEDAIREIVPDYKRPESVQNAMDGKTKEDE
jgi:L1 cell adhesion molecule like protein